MPKVPKIEKKKHYWYYEADGLYYQTGGYIMREL